MLGNYGATIRLAESMLSDALGCRARLSRISKFDSRHLVLCCKLEATSDHAPASVVLKQFAVDAPPEQQPHPLNCFANELANLRFFGGLRNQLNVGPQLYRAHHGAGLLIVEDLGAHQTLQDVLRGNNPRLAMDTLLKFGQLLGKVQVAALNKEGDFQAPSVDAGISLPPSVGIQDIRDAMADLGACLDALQVRPPAGLRDAIARMEDAIHDASSPFRTWLHCDLKTQNVLCLENAQVQLLDFEYAGFGHALLDAVSVRMAFPPPPVPVINSGQKVPAAMVRRFEDAYRAAIIRGIPKAVDHACYHKALVQACAHWALVKLLSMWRIHLKERLAEGKAYDSGEAHAAHRAGYARFRQQGVAYLQTFVATAEQFDQLPITREVARMVIAALLRVWPEIRPLPYFPAFTNGPDFGSI
jgi:hypothetical protein